MMSIVIGLANTLLHGCPVHILPRNNKRPLTKYVQKHVLKITAGLTHLKSSVVGQSLIQDGKFFIQKKKMIWLLLQDLRNYPTRKCSC